MASNTNDCYDSGSTEYQTPPEIYNPILEIMGKDKFTFDVCTSLDNIPAEVGFIKEMNGLLQPWIKLCWMNPPFNQCPKWVKKAIEETKKPSCEVWGIIPARTKEKYFQELLKAVKERGFMVFIEGRVKFILDGYQDPKGYRHPCVLFYLCSHPGQATKLKNKWLQSSPIKGEVFGV
jgi:hypothetical protein